jgi:tRNA(Ile)-lysidine synthase
MPQPKDVVGELRRFLHEARIDREAGVLLAVSGGRDSMALAKAFVMLNAKSDKPWRVHAAAVDHGLREAAAKEAVFVQTTLVHWGMSCETVRLQPPKRMPLGTLAWAREGRYAALETIRNAFELRYVATAHHLDDQAETVLLRLVRGAAPATLGGMRPIQGALLRPLLSVRRDDIDRFVKKHGVPYVDDPSNRDPAHPRATVRHEILPLLERLGGSGVPERLAALASDLADDEDALRALVPVVRGTTLPLKALPANRALRRRMLWTWLRPLAHPAGALQRAHVETCMALVDGADRDAHCKLPGGAVIVRQKSRLALREAPPLSRTRRR